MESRQQRLDSLLYHCRLVEDELQVVAGLRQEAPEERLAQVGLVERVDLVRHDLGPHLRQRIVLVRVEGGNLAELSVLQLLNFAFQR